MSKEDQNRRTSTSLNLESMVNSRGYKGKAFNGSTTPQLLEILRLKKDLMEEALERENMKLALKKVKQNKGVPGIDHMTIEELEPYLKQEWPRIKELLLKGKYKPQGIKTVQIPKKAGGIRTLGIPTVMDRLIQQAVNQTLQKYIDPSFHERSYGFRPGRSAHQAINKAMEEMTSGKDIIIDLDIEKFFDQVNHDRLMNKLWKMIGDQRVLDLIRAYLNTIAKREGVPQGGPLSPLLSNIYLDELDKELSKRNLSFVRYADDILIFVKSPKASERVYESIKEYLSRKLKLKINQEKSKVAKTAKFLGFILTKKSLKIRQENIKEFKDKIRELTKIRGGKSIYQILKRLNPVIRGWGLYFALSTGGDLTELDKWIRRRIRACFYASLKNGSTRLKAFVKAGINHKQAYMYAYSSRGDWRSSSGKAVRIILNNKKLKEMGLVNLRC